MPNHFIVTITGPDRIGFVEGVTKRLLAHGANVEKSRMVRLGGDFAMLMLVSVSEVSAAAMTETVHGLEAEGCRVSVHTPATDDTGRYAGRLPWRITVNGADHEGIIHHVTRYLAEHAVDIETLSTGAAHAPMSGTPLFSMEALVLAPSALSLGALRNELELVGDRLSVDIEVLPFGSTEQ